VGEERVSLTLEYVTDPSMHPVKRLASNLKDAFAYFGLRQVFLRREPAADLERDVDRQALPTEGAGHQIPSGSPRSSWRNPANTTWFDLETSAFSVRRPRLSAHGARAPTTLTARGLARLTQELQVEAGSLYLAPRRNRGVPVPSQSNGLPSTRTRQPMAGCRGRRVSVLRGPAAPLRGQTEPAAEAADRVAADRQPLNFAELLGAVAVIELPVGGLDQFQDAVPQLDIQPRGRGPAPQAMHQPPDAGGPIPRLEAPELPRAHLQAPGSLSGRDLPSHGQLQQARPAGFLATHRDGLPCLHGRTFLQRS
jgi:hypothetical protein